MTFIEHVFVSFWFSHSFSGFIIWHHCSWYHTLPKKLETGFSISSASRPQRRSKKSKKGRLPGSFISLQISFKRTVPVAKQHLNVSIIFFPKKTPNFVQNYLQAPQVRNQLGSSPAFPVSPATAKPNTSWRRRRCRRCDARPRRRRKALGRSPSRRRGSWKNVFGAQGGGNPGVFFFF